MFSKNINIALIVSISIILASCSKYQKLLKSSDYAAKYENGVKYFEKKDYFRAVGLFEELENIYKGSGKAEKIQYYMAYCYYNQGDHILASYYFKSLSNKYPFSEHREECEYMAAYCSYLNSPDPNLDQTYTYKAMEDMQLFINKFPTSSRIPECNRIIDQLRSRLETKSFNAAKLYFDIGDYKAAIIAFKNGLNDFPDTPFKEDMLYLTLKSSFLLAENSITYKKAERYQNAVDEYYTLIAEYPQTKYIKEAQRIFENSTDNLKN